MTRTTSCGGPTGSYLLDTLVHELNAVRGLLGEPDRLEYVDLRKESVSVMLRFGDTPLVAIHWIDLPRITGSKMEFALLLRPHAGSPFPFPSPFLRNESHHPRESQDGDVGTGRSAVSREIASIRERLQE